MKRKTEAKRRTHFDQSGVIPYRRKNGTLEVLLVTTIRKKNWIIPKGFIEYHLSPFQSAKKEAFEEAGVRGSNTTRILGSYKAKKNGSELLTKVYSMRVTAVYKDYPEKNLRKRKWLSATDAAKKVSIPEVAKMIRKFGRNAKK
ncbi:MAG: NUDIX hydrolase [Ignavibacteriaceae bacterium]|jgi:8-oxo-dGTP pyrophosphatase MutT (NUDIX family)|nr:NUDIX hydrolase [Ignavibacteriaceae bacterium]MCW9094645.1 NUDIX hydrolase [Ignavibacteriaceae bacterium]MCW9096828.1 NUDIX hydrolase [Ignavibacteriaceae bacterium]